MLVPCCARWFEVNAPGDTGAFASNRRLVVAEGADGPELRPGRRLPSLHQPRVLTG